VVTIERDGSRRANAMHWRKPLVVLIDEGTRSGKEVMAYGLKRLGVPIVGTTSAGAVVAGASYLLPDDSFLYLAVADILVEGRWVVERTLAWLGRCRRLAKDREASVASAEAWIFVAHIRLLTRRLARFCHVS
jgi:hypothetical protein